MEDNLSSSIKFKTHMLHWPASGMIVKATDFHLADWTVLNL